MANSVEDFFNIINEKTWRSNISDEASVLFDKMIEELQDNKEEIIEGVVNDIKRIEHIKVEEQENFEYSTFKKWLNHYIRETMQEYLEDEWI
jgi:hypothetical protein